MRKNLVLVLVSALAYSPLLASSECTCDLDQVIKESNSISGSLALRYKLVAIASILVSSAIGISLPLMGKSLASLRPGTNLFFLVKSLAAGVILATGFVHILPDAFESLTSACLVKANPVWDKFPFAGFIAMVSAILTMMVDVFASSYCRGESATNDGNDVVARCGDEEDAKVEVDSKTNLHGHSHGFLDANDEEILFRHRVISQVLEVGIVVHSVIIGVSLGASQSAQVIKPLVAALTFHQFFEGMGLGGCISQAKLKSRAVAVMVAFFSLTTPVGIAIGIGISHFYDDNTPKALMVEGAFNAAAAGILIYMALVDLLAHDFMGPKMQANLRLMIGSTFSLLLGAGCMSMLAKWA